MFTSFGRKPDAKRKKAFAAVPNYRKGQFQNPVPTPSFSEDSNMLKAMREFMRRHADTVPEKPLPIVKTDLLQADRSANVLVWFGHSSYYLQVEGCRILVDPVFSNNASPVPGSVVAFKGPDQFSIDDIPNCDLLLISHDHWDHLDYATIKQLKGRIGKVICGLGVAEHFTYWGWDPELLVEKNWHDSLSPFPGIQLTLTPARHFSGRGFKRNVSLWTSFVLETAKRKLFLGGDSGYGPHFTEIGKNYGPFDLAILECGQYNKNWPFIHSFPEELVIEAMELNAKNMMPVHHSKFKLAQHPWYEPLQQVVRAASQSNIPVTTPRIGELVALDHLGQTWDTWWENLMPA